jgi:hypothetical protein
MYNYIQKITGKSYGQLNHFFVHSFEQFMEIQEVLKTKNIDIIHILHNSDDISSLPWGNLVHMEQSGTTRLGIQTSFNFYANVDGLIAYWLLNIEKGNDHQRYLQINTKLVKQIIRLLNGHETILQDFKKTLKLVHTQISYNKDSLYHIYQRQTEHLDEFDEFINDIINTI